MRRAKVGWQIAWRVALVVAGAAFGGGRAWAGDGPLVVVVEVEAGACCAPDEVRRAVEGELGERVVGAGEVGATGAGRLLLVTVGREQLAMSLRAGDAKLIVSRAIPVAADRAERLKTIAWLAGNLVRDQVAGIVAVRERTQPPLLALPPRPLQSPQSSIDPGAPDASLARTAPPAGAGGVPIGWTVTVAGGQGAMMGLGLTTDSYVRRYDVLHGMSWQLEVAHRASRAGLTFGAALDAGPAAQTSVYGHLLGAAALVGSGWQRGRWLLEASAGVGIEAVNSPRVTQTVTNSSLTGTSTEVTVSGAVGPALYGRALVGAGIAVSRSIDLVARATAHLPTTRYEHYFLAATFGLRLRLP